MKDRDGVLCMKLDFLLECWKCDCSKLGLWEQKDCSIRFLFFILLMCFGVVFLVDGVLGVVLVWTQTIYVKTFGCSHNQVCVVEHFLVGGGCFAKP